MYPLIPSFFCSAPFISVLVSGGKITIQQFGDSCDLQYSTPSPKAPLSHSVSHKVFLKTLGQTSVALQKYGPKGRTLRDSRGKGGSVGAYTQKDNETEKRGTMSKAGHGGLLSTSLYIIYNELCTKVCINSKNEKNRATFTLHGSMTIPLGFPCAIAADTKHISAGHHVKQAVSQSSTCSLSFHGLAELKQFTLFNYLQIPLKACFGAKQSSVST